MRWHILTGEYPASGDRSTSDRGSNTGDHSTGGVADYTRLVAQGLVAAGDAVDVWVPAGRSDAADTVPLWSDEGVVVHGLPYHFAGRSLVNLTQIGRAHV